MRDTVECPWMVTIGVILAAGGSRRMGTPKALLLVDGMALVRRHEAAVHPLCDEVRVVLGGHAEAVGAALGPHARRILNPRWQETGPAESLLLAVADLPPEARVLVTPVDVPPAPHAALVALLSAAGGGVPAVVGHHGQPGHPVLVRAGDLQTRIPLGQNLREILGDRVRQVEAGTADVLRNLNTPGEWAAWTGQPPLTPRDGDGDGA